MRKILATMTKIPGVKVVGGTLRLFYFLFRARNYMTLIFAPPGHFYSPLPDLRQFRDAGITSGASPTESGIDMREEAQMELLEQLSAHYAELPFKDTSEESARVGTRYHYRNSYFSYGDAIVLYGMMRHFRPNKIVEVGSGFSSAVMLDTDEHFLGGKTTFRFIEPFPDRLRMLLGQEDMAEDVLIRSPLQKVEKSIFESLCEGDILFVDSSHVAKVNSDVNRLLFEILPGLRKGVLIHFHDILWPFEYPAKWIEQGRAWNEAYVLRAFLQYNNAFEIVYFNSFMAANHEEHVRKNTPLCLRNPGGSIWLRKVQ